MSLVYMKWNRHSFIFRQKI